MPSRVSARAALSALLATGVSAGLALSTLGAVPAAQAAPVPAAPAAPAAADGAAPSSLTVNGIDTPVDVEGAPNFGWHVATAAQTSYQIVVSTSADAAAAGEGDVWDSGKVDSAAQTSVTYAGPDLDPAQRYSWSVRTWDGEGAAGDWAEPASFGTGPGNDWAATPIWADVESDNWTHRRHLRRRRVRVPHRDERGGAVRRRHRHRVG